MWHHCPALSFLRIRRSHLPFRFDQPHLDSIHCPEQTEIQAFPSLECHISLLLPPKPSDPQTRSTYENIPSVAHRLPSRQRSMLGASGASRPSRGRSESHLITIRSMQQQVADTLGQDRTVAQLTGAFGLLAQILAAVGLYGVTD